MKVCKKISLSFIILLGTFCFHQISAQAESKFNLHQKDSLFNKYRISFIKKSSFELKMPEFQHRAFFCKMEDRYFQNKSGRLAFRLGSLEAANRMEYGKE
ncbi:MAG: hypothetical protein IPO62_11215 [Saprospiraceae bacterium]|nr:hypothetical protein [Saprospiraceae bacterium]